jgi:hypothetical protein
MTFAFARGGLGFALLASALLVACGGDGDGDGNSTSAGGQGGTTAQAGGGSVPSPEGWHPSSGEPPHYGLQPDGSFHVHPSHPRLYFRSDDLEWLVARGAGALSGYWGELDWMASSMAALDPAGPEATDNVEGWYGDKAQAIALMALLTDDADYRTWAVAWAKALGALALPTDDTVLRSRLQRLAVVYDWLHDTMAAADRDEVRTALVSYVETLRDWDYIQDPGYIGGHERWGYAVFAMGLIALYGEYPPADALLAQCRQHIAHGFYPAQAWIAEDGGYHMGWAYGSSYSNFDLPYLVWTVGTNDVLLDDWLAETGSWYLYGLQGDDRFPPAADAFSVDPSLGAVNSIYAAGIGQRAESRWFLDDKLEANSEAFLELLLSDPSVAAASPDGLPLGRLFRRAGLLVSRDGWGADSTHVAFKSGAFFSINHHHRDENTFTVHYLAPLAIDSGYYDSYGSDHWRNYFTRTIAHNGIVVFDPAQQMTLYGEPVSNDGGQIFAEEPRTLADIQPGGHASLDGVVRSEEHPELSYALGDATKAYDPAYVTLAQREIVVLRDLDRPHPAIVLFDRVGQASADSVTRFLLHTIDQPTIDGAMMVNERGGARLTSITLYPTDATLNLVGGAGAEFTVDGVSYPLDPNGGEPPPSETGLEPGAWRLEVSPGQQATSHELLHVLLVDDASAALVDPSVAALIDDPAAVGAEVAGWTVVFPRAAGGVSAMQYTAAQSGSSRHFVTGLPPGTSVSYSVSGTSLGTVTTGPGGCALFELSANAGDVIRLE